MEREATYGATDGPGRPSMEAILGPGDIFWGDHRWNNRSASQVVKSLLYAVRLARLLKLDTLLTFFIMNSCLYRYVYISSLRKN